MILENFLDGLKIFSPFGNKYKLGIDIGASSIKVVVTKEIKGNFKLIGIAYEETPSGLIIDGYINNHKQVAQVINDTILKTGVKSYKNMIANLGLKGVGIVFRRLILPFSTREDLAQQIYLEAQQQIESDLSDWIVDYNIVSEPDIQGQIVVILAGAKKRLVNDYVSLMSNIGLKIGVLDFDIFSIYNSLEYSYGSPIPECVLCLDIGRDTTKFHLIQDSVPLIVRNFSTGGIHLTEAISKTIGADYDVSESLKIASANEADTQAEVDKAIRIYVADMVTEIKQTIEFFSSSNSDVKFDVIDKIILSGGGALTKGFAEALSEYLHTSVEFANPFNQMLNVENFQIDYPFVYNVAVGLSLRKIGDKNDYNQCSS